MRSRVDDRGRRQLTTPALGVLLVIATLVALLPLGTLPLAALPIGAAPAARADDSPAAAHTLGRLELPVGGAGVSDIASDGVTHTLYVADDNSLVAVDELTGASRRFAEGLGGHLDHVAVDPQAHEVFATLSDDYEGRWVVVFAEATLGKIATIPIAGNGVAAIAVDHAAQTVIVVGRGLGTVAPAGVATFISETVNEVRSSTPLGRDPQAVAVDEDSGTIYVANTIDGTVSLLDAATRSVFATVTTGDDPSGIGIDSTSHRAYVTNWGSGTVSAIAETRDPSTGLTAFSVMATTSVADSPWGVAVDSSTQVVYVAPEGASHAAIVNEWSGAVTEEVGPIESNPIAITVDETLHAAFVIARNSLTISVIAPALVLAPPRECGFGWCA